MDWFQPSRIQAMTHPVSLSRAIARGFAMKCPNCGRGHLFCRFLKVADRCEACGEDYTPQRADDFPAYLVIVVVGHIVVPALLAVEITYAPPAWVQLAIWLPVTLFGALGLLQGRDRRAAMGDRHAWLRRRQAPPRRGVRCRSDRGPCGGVGLLARQLCGLAAWLESSSLRPALAVVLSTISAASRPKSLICPPLLLAGNPWLG